MIVGHFHEGSGCGNQLFRYLATRIKAEELGTDFGMLGSFKGAPFLDIDEGKEVSDTASLSVWNEKRVDNPEGVDIRPYDATWGQIEDNTVIDGEFQDYKYFGHRLDDIRQWLDTERYEYPIPFAKQDEICVIAHRGGEYVGLDDLYLPREYWYTAMEHMKKRVPGMKFGVVTDDPEEAQLMFPNFPIHHEMANDWRAIRYAKHLILSNSSFGIIPALLNDEKENIIAPWGWARHNRGFWALPQNQYPGWEYQKLDGSLETV